MTKAIDVVGAVIVRDDLVFAAQRGPGRSMAGLWEFPGGKIEPGESPQEALRRELVEELDVTVDVRDKIVTTRHETETAVIYLTTFFCSIVSGTPTLTEHQEMRWVPRHHLHDLDWAPADLETVARVQSA